MLVASHASILTPSYSDAIWLEFQTLGCNKKYRTFSRHFWRGQFCRQFFPRSRWVDAHANKKRPFKGPTKKWPLTLFIFFGIWVENMSSYQGAASTCQQGCHFNVVCFWNVPGYSTTGCYFELCCRSQHSNRSYVPCRFSSPKIPELNQN